MSVATSVGGAARGIAPTAPGEVVASHPTDDITVTEAHAQRATQLLSSPG